MSLRSKILVLVDVILRVPPLFIIDELLRIGLGLSHSDEADSKVLNNESPEESHILFNQSVTSEFFDRDILGSKYLFITLVKVISSLLGKHCFI